MTYQADPEEKRLRRIERTIDALKYHVQNHNKLLQEIADIVADLRLQNPNTDPLCRAVTRERESLDSLHNISGK